MKLIVANWKCNPQSLAEAKRLFNSIKKGIRNVKNCEIVICPPFVYLPIVSSFIVHRSSFKLGAQDCFWEDYNPPTALPLKRAPKGAFTGQISPLMLKDLGCEYVIVGHSEKRALGENDEMINKKLKSAIKAKLKPILCIGETFEEKKKGKTLKILRNQLKKDLKGLINSSTHQLINLIVAYEPVWAIGTGNACQPKEAKEVLKFLKKITHQLINSSTNKLLYGGSVNSKNAADYINIGFDGLLVGGASLNPKEFAKIIKSIPNS
jgi:triosephosphate isomerase